MSLSFKGAILTNLGPEHFTCLLIPVAAWRKHCMSEPSLRGGVAMPLNYLCSGVLL